jgi:hypothetical protein
MDILDPLYLSLRSEILSLSSSEKKTLPDDLNFEELFNYISDMIITKDSHKDRGKIVYTCSNNNTHKKQSQSRSEAKSVLASSRKSKVDMECSFELTVNKKQGDNYLSLKIS